MDDDTVEDRATIPVDVAARIAADLEHVATAERLTSERLKLIRAKRRFIEGVEGFDADGSPGGLWLFLVEQERTLQRIARGGGEIPDWVQPLRDGLQQVLQEAARSWPKTFVAELEQRDLEPDRGSRHPTYTFMDGFLSVQLDERKLAVRLTSRNADTVVLPLDPAAVADEVHQTQRRLLDREFDADAFLQALFAAYDATTEDAGAARGDEERLPVVLERLAREQDRPADELLIDLGRLLKQGTPEHEGRRLRLGHTRRDKDGVLVPGFEGGGYLGFIAFRDEGETR